MDRHLDISIRLNNNDKETGIGDINCDSTNCEETVYWANHDKTITIGYDEDYVKPNACCLRVTHLVISSCLVWVSAAVLLFAGYLTGSSGSLLVRLRQPVIGVLVLGLLVFSVAVPVAARLEWRRPRDLSAGSNQRADGDRVGEGGSGRSG